MKDLFTRYGVYAIVVANCLITAVVALIIQHYSPPVADLTGLSLMPPKVTLLSVIIALGLVQYNYFYNESREIEDRIEKGDFGPFWADYIKQAEGLRVTLNNPDALAGVAPEKVDALQATLKHMDETINAARHEWIAHLHDSLAAFVFRFGVIFSIALLIFSSVTLDFVFQVWGLKPFNPEFYSLITFLMAIVLGLLYVFFLIFLVQGQIRSYHRTK